MLRDVKNASFERILLTGQDDFARTKRKFQFHYKVAKTVLSMFPSILFLVLVQEMTITQDPVSQNLHSR